MEYILNSNSAFIVENLIKTIQENKDYLSEIDGAIGDGDHGINMNKGFTMCKERIQGKDMGLSEALKVLGRVLLMEIGGSMGPLYGTFFIEMSKEIKDKEKIDKVVFRDMIKRAINGVEVLGKAKVGDKTLMDTLIPAIDAYEIAIDEDKSFSLSLEDMKVYAEAGKESTRDLVAKIGRSSRLGERSRGVLDAGATSCNLILKSIADSIIMQLGK
jgi:phosphoenolpyruvate---glycerone phosphotransferase subunit DhaL